MDRLAAPDNPVGPAALAAPQERAVPVVQADRVARTVEELVAKVAMAAEQYARTDARKMPPEVFFLPGTGASPGFWKPVGERLPGDWTKHYFGWPGLGDEPADPAIKSYDDLIALVETRLGEEPVDLVAQSMGGFIAARVALAHPKKIRRLVLTATSGGIDLAPFGVSDWRPDYRKAYPDAQPWITEGRAVPNLPVEKIACPTLLLWADADPISPLAIGRHLETRLPNARLHVISSTEHRFAATHAAEVAPLIAAHLSAQP